MAVSKRHAALSVDENGKIWLESLCPSTTELNGKAVTDKTLVEHNNVLLIGTRMFRVEYCENSAVSGTRHSAPLSAGDATHTEECSAPKKSRTPYKPATPAGRAKPKEFPSAARRSKRKPVSTVVSVNEETASTRLSFGPESISAVREHHCFCFSIFMNFA
jgi:hypothetical protein